MHAGRERYVDWRYLWQRSPANGDAQLIIIQSDSHPGFEWQVSVPGMAPIAYGNETVYPDKTFKISGGAVDLKGSRDSCNSVLAEGHHLVEKAPGGERSFHAFLSLELADARELAV